MSRASRRRALVLAAVLFASFAYFYEGGGWNQNTRFDAVRAIVEQHTLIIDLYHENTGDKAQVGSHYYLDKAPGATLTAVPAVALTRGLLRAVRGRINSRSAIVAYSYVATLAAAAAPAALAAVCVFFVALWCGADDSAAGVAAVVCGLGTPLWAYATLFYGHALAAGCLAAAFLGAIYLGDPENSRRTALVGCLTAFAAAWAVVTEYPAAIPAGLIVAWAWWRQRRNDPASLTAVTLAIGAGLALGAIVLLAYNTLAFGKPFYIAYTSEAGSYEAMRTGVFGINLPSPSTMWQLLFGSYRGLLPLAPVLAIAPIGFWFLLRDPRTREAAAVAAAVGLYYFALTSGYAYWDGGWSYGSRHLGPALPFICVGLAPLWMRAPRAVRAAIVALALVGIGESLVAVATTPQPPNGVERPMAELLWPAFRSGDFPIGWQSVLDLRPPKESMSALEANAVPRAAWNLGQLAGLSGFVSLLPLAGFWTLGGVAWARAHRTASRIPYRF